MAEVSSPSVGQVLYKLSCRAVKVGADLLKAVICLDIDECASIDYQLREGEPGFEVETNFWSPVAHRTRTKSKII